MHRQMRFEKISAFLKKRLVAAIFFAGLAAPALAADPENCGTIVIPPNSDITSFSPLFADLQANGQAALLMYPALIWLNSDDEIDWSRSLASAITSPDNGLNYDITLRPWVWSDGVAVTSADVLYNFKLIKELGPNYPGYGSGGMPFLIKSITAPDALHVHIVLTHAVNPEWFIYNGISQLQPLPAHDWSRYTLDQIFQLQSTPSFYRVVDGPLKLVSFHPGLTATFVPNPAWPGPPVHFNQFVFSMIESDGASLQQVEAGDIDFTAVPTEFWNNVQNLPGLKLVYLAPQSTWDYIGLNFRNNKIAFLRDVRVRDAIEDAIDQPTMIKLVLHGQGYPVYGPITSADGQFMAPQLKAGNYPVGYDPAKALALLAQAGFTRGPDGVMQKNGTKLSFTALSPTGSTEGNEMSEFIQADLAKIGIDMKIREMEFNQMIALEDSQSDNWDAVFGGWAAGGYPSGETAFQTGAYDNSSDYSNPEMDQLINDSINKPGLDALFKYEIYASAQQPEIFTPAPWPPLLVRDRMQGVAAFYDPGGLDVTKLYCTAK